MKCVTTHYVPRMISRVLCDIKFLFQDIETKDGDCIHGSVRLVGEDIDDDEVRAREGRVEVCINRAWGTVCDELFQREDAEVVCEQLNGFDREGNRE